MPFHGLWLGGRNSAWPRKPTVGLFNIFYFSCTLSVTLIAPPKISISEVLICLECLSLNSCFSVLRKSSLEQDVFKPILGYQEYPNLVVIVNVCQLDWCGGGGRLWFEAWVNFFAVNNSHCGGFQAINQTSLNGAQQGCLQLALTCHCTQSLRP